VKQSLKGSEFSWNDSGGKYFLRRSDCVCPDASIMQWPNCRPEVQPVAVRMEPPATLTTETDPSLRKPRSASSTPAAVQRNLAEPGGVPGPRSHPDRSGDIVKASGSIGAGAQGLDGRQ